MSEQNVGDQALVEDLTKDQEESPKRDVRKRAHRSPLKQGFLLQQSPKLPAAKKTKPRGTLWTVFRRGARKSASHFWAHCMPCEEAGEEAKVAGVAENTTSLSDPDAVDDGLDDISTLTSADEFDAEVHEWFRELELEALEDEDDEPGSSSSVIRSASLAEIFGSALEPLLSEEDLCSL